MVLEKKKMEVPKVEEMKPREAGYHERVLLPRRRFGDLENLDPEKLELFSYAKRRSPTFQKILIKKMLRKGGKLLA